jgi:hypothetical protein
VAPSRPDLEPAELALIVGAALAMLNATSLIESPLSPSARADLLRDLTLTCLGCQSATGG